MSPGCPRLDGEAAIAPAVWGGAPCTLTEDDAAHRLQAVATATTNAGTASAVSDASDLIGAAPAPSATGKLASVNLARDHLRLTADDGTGAVTLASCARLHEVGQGCAISRPRIALNLGMITFESRDDAYGEGAGQIYTVNADGTGLRHVISGSDPAWTPDGTRLVYTATDPDDPGATRAMVAAADGLAVACARWTSELRKARIPAPSLAPSCVPILARPGTATSAL